MCPAAIFSRAQELGWAQQATDDVGMGGDHVQLLKGENILRLAQQLAHH
jgi:hypothetical protein